MKPSPAKRRRIRLGADAYHRLHQESARWRGGHGKGSLKQFGRPWRSSQDSASRPGSQKCNLVALIHIGTDLFPTISTGKPPDIYLWYIL